jgi:hypothetical protein
MMLKYYTEYCGRPSLFDRVCSGRTPLHESAESGMVDACDILLKNGADVDAKDNM